MARSKALYNLSGRLGMTTGMDTQAVDMVTEDNDGEIPSSTNYSWVVDISHLLSEQMGKQMPMMATYRVKGIHLSLRNVNNTVDNDNALCIGGTVSYYSPTKHRIDALQHARTYVRSANYTDSEEDQNNPFSPYTEDKKYKGLRFNWSADNEVAGAVKDHTAILNGDRFSLEEILDHYNRAISGDPQDYGYTYSNGIGDALWNSRTGVLETDGLYWVTSYTNRILDMQGALFNPATDDDDSKFFAPSSVPWEANIPSGNHLSVLGGLLKFSAWHTNTDSAGWLEDEYYIQCTVQVEGWEEF